MADDDRIEIKIRLPAPAPPSPRHRIVIDGETVLEFPEGTTREEAQAAIDEGRRVYVREKIQELRKLRTAAPTPEAFAALDFEVMRWEQVYFRLGFELPLDCDGD